MRAVKTARTKCNGDRGGHLMECGKARQVYNCMVELLGDEKPETDVFTSLDAPQLRKCTRQSHKGNSAWSKRLVLKDADGYV